MTEYRVFFPAEGPVEGEPSSRAGLEKHPTVRALEEAIGLRFRNPEVALRAVTHSSYANEAKMEGGDYERLEFLGDAVLDFLAGFWLYHHFPNLSEGELTRIRSALVRTETLAALGRKVGLGSILRVGRGEGRSGGRERETILCGAFEALVGAITIDSSVYTAYVFLEPFFKRQADKLGERSANTDSKSLFQEWAQSERGVTPAYKVVSEDGPDHERRYTIAVFVGEEEFGRGSGTSKQVAAQVAAHNALESGNLHPKKPLRGKKKAG
jgi:ribonuclease III